MINILTRNFWEYKEWVFSLTETAEQTYDISVESSLLKLKEVLKEYENIPAQIENLEKRRESLKKFYNDWLQVLIDAKENIEELKELELPNSL